MKLTIIAIALFASGAARGYKMQISDDSALNLSCLLQVQAQSAEAAGTAQAMTAGQSLLARQLEDSADVYTSRVANFLLHTPYAYLRAPRGRMPHDAVGG